MNPLRKKETYTIRPVKETDLEALAMIHVISFNATYPTYEPKPGYPFRLRQWQQHFREREGRWFCWVAIGSNSEPVGFATGHDCKDASLPYEAQLDKIHLLSAARRLGLGTILVAAVAATFLQRDQTSMILFADPENKAIRFYDRLGGERLLDADGLFTGAFGWKNIAHLAAFFPPGEENNRS